MLCDNAWWCRHVCGIRTVTRHVWIARACSHRCDKLWTWFTTSWLRHPWWTEIYRPPWSTETPASGWHSTSRMHAARSKSLRSVLPKHAIYKVYYIGIVSELYVVYIACRALKEFEVSVAKTWHYSGTPFERPPWWEATPSWKATGQCKSKHEWIDLYPWREATSLERPLFWCKRGGLTRGVPLYLKYIELVWYQNYKLFIIFSVQYFKNTVYCVTGWKVLLILNLYFCLWCIDIWSYQAMPFQIHNFAHTIWYFGDVFKCSLFFIIHFSWEKWKFIFEIHLLQHLNTA